MMTGLETGSAPAAPVPTRDKPVDLVFLARQTFGDRALEAEVLRLFLGQGPRLLAEIAAATGEDRARTAHRLVGSARAVGAWLVAEEARLIEGGAGDLAALERAVTRASGFIREILDDGRIGRAG